MQLVGLIFRLVRRSLKAKLVEEELKAETARRSLEVELVEKGEAEFVVQSTELVWEPLKAVRRMLEGESLDLRPMCGVAASNRSDRCSASPLIHPSSLSRSEAVRSAPPMIGDPLGW